MLANAFRKSIPALAFCCLAMAALAAEPEAARKPVALPPPAPAGGKPVIEAIRARQSIKALGAKPVTTATLSTLLWAAYGVNRPESGGRTVPSAVKSYEIDVYVLLAQGAYVYEPLQHALRPVAPGDLRARTGPAAPIKDAPIQIVYIADHARQGKTSPEKKSVYSAVHCGFIGQNVYLFCASEGLGTVFREFGGNRPALAKELGLRPDQEIMFAQTVGYPAK